MAAKHIGLGRGLNALIKEAPTAATPAEAATASGITRIPVNKIHKSPFQPRHHFDTEALADLVQSVRERGVIQPLLVRRVNDDYQLIAGERRFRAAQEAELRDVPVIVLEVSDREALEIALIENLQREDLNPIEEAEGYQALTDKFGMTQEQIAERVGKSRPSVANALRLLALPESIRQLITRNQVTSGHAKVLLGLEIAREQELLANRIAKEGLSVRALENIVAALKKPHRKQRVERSDIPASHLQHLTDRLQQQFGTSVRIVPCKTLADGKKVRGRVEIDYYSTDDLDRLLSLLGLSESI